MKMTRFLAVASAGVTLVGLALLVPGCSSSKSRVVLYCAQDQEFAELVFDDFQKRTGLTILPHFDIEGNKSVMIYEELVREADRPRCDVHWNNEIVSTIRLQRKGLLEPYGSPSAADYPKWCRGPDDTWHAFGARARVLLINTKLVPEADRPRSIFDLTQPRWKGKIGIAKPTSGTTATQAACLFEVLGPEAAREFYLALKANGVQVVPGNKQVAEGVSAGQFAVGLTDTDDAMIEITDGKPVAMIFPDRDGHKDHPRMGTLFIPNTVAVVRGCPNPEGAKKLVDFLLSPDVEKRLAESGSRQIPLNPKVKADLPPQMDRPRDAGGNVKSMDVDFGRAADLWEQTQTFLIKEFIQP